MRGHSSTHAARRYIVCGSARTRRLASVCTPSGPEESPHVGRVRGVEVAQHACEPRGHPRPLLEATDDVVHQARHAHEQLNEGGQAVLGAEGAPTRTLVAAERVEIACERAVNRLRRELCALEGAEQT